MADFSHILATRPDFDDEDREWLHHLVADWQVIADLSFADLLLLVQDGDGKYVVAEQCRPSTVMTLRAEDVVGNVMPDDMVGELDAAMLSSVVFRSTVLRTVGKATVCNVYAPVRHNGKTLGLVVRETNMATRESNGRYESESINAGKHLYEMIPRGQFPYKDSVMSQRHIARVADGFIILTMDGVVRYAAPNAISCFRRLGLLTTMPGHYLSELGTQLLKENDPVPETLPLVLTGKAEVFNLKGNRRELKADDCIIVPAGVPTGVDALRETIYTEINFGRHTEMNKQLKTGEVFAMKDLVPYEDGKIVNMDVVANDKTKFVVMSFDKGTGLGEHAAPGDALIFALDGDGIIGYEGKEYRISAGENFRFSKGGKHYVKANDKFKMALLLTLE